MRATEAVRTALIAILLGGVFGCRPSTTQTPSSEAVAAQASAGAADTQPVASDKPIPVKAYINVSSGCQEPTVDLLKRMAGQNPRLQLDLIDFGQPEGSRRWRADGFSCMTILINGHNTVTYGPRGNRQIVSFQFPPGFQWALQDLEGALKGALDGTVYYGAEAGATRVESRMPTLRITSRESVINGKKVGEVVINGQVAIRLRTTFDGLPPLQRAEQAAARLKRAIAMPGFHPSGIRVGKVTDGVALIASDKVLAIADAPQATLLNTTPEKLAQGWASALRKALAAATASQ
ncbi:MAG: hypothetical protein FJX74_14160 [Armatimonadetes bacterium]|nr:hypothetical protein [Armatimonadota bacterium]